MDTSKYRLQRMENLEGLMLSERIYNLAIGVTLLAGILVNILMATYLSDIIMAANYLVMLVVYLVGSFACTFVIYRSKNPAVSFLGFLGLSVSMGLLLTYYLTWFHLADIQLAFVMTGIVLGIMVVLATALPQFFLSIGRSLGVALLVTIVVEVIASFLFPAALRFADYVVVLIFCGYVGFDWARAQQYPKTLDNAVDSAADIYVDIVNLFIRILSILGRRDD